MAQSKAQNVARQYAASGLQGLLPQLNAQQSYGLQLQHPNVQQAIIKQKIPQEPGNIAFAQAINKASQGNQYNNGEPGTLNELTNSGSGVSNNQNLIPEGVGINSKQATDLVNVIQKQKKIDLQQQAESRKASEEVRNFIDPYVKKAHSAQDKIKNYNLAIKGAKSGNLRPGHINQLLDKIGLHGLGQNATQAVTDKALATLGIDAATAYGSGTKLTNYLEQTFQRTLPSLHNDPQALIGISEINKKGLELVEYETEAVKKLVKKWGKTLPEDAQFQVDEAVKPYREQNEKEVYKLADDLNALVSGLGEEQDTLPAPEKDAQYYVSDLGINVFSPDGKTYIREDNGQPFDWNQYNQGVK